MYGRLSGLSRHIYPSISRFETLTTMSPSGRGAFILFEGVDRAGKTTQVKMLVEFLQKSGKAEMMRFPDRTTTIGKMINDYLTSSVELDDHAIHLLFSANRWESVPKLKKLLEEGVTVVVDRYSYSGVAFSASKAGMDVDWCMNPEIGLPRPDAVIFLDLPAEEAKKRGEYGAERYENEEMQKKVRENFFLLKKNAQPEWNVLDASASMEDLQEQIRGIVSKVQATVQGSELKVL